MPSKGLDCQAGSSMAGDCPLSAEEPCWLILSCQLPSLLLESQAGMRPLCSWSSAPGRLWALGERGRGRGSFWKVPALSCSGSAWELERSGALVPRWGD